MSAVEIRPRFHQHVALPSEEILNRIRHRLPESNQVWGRITDAHVVIGIPEADRHFWSPQLSLEVESDGATSAQIKGLFGPSPTVWLMFVFLYALFGFISVIIAIIGFSQVNLGLSGAILWALPVVFGIIVMMFLSARAGQKMGHDQMKILYRFLQDALQQEHAMGAS